MRLVSTPYLWIAALFLVISMGCGSGIEGPIPPGPDALDASDGGDAGDADGGPDALDADDTGGVGDTDAGDSNDADGVDDTEISDADSEISDTDGAEVDGDTEIDEGETNDTGDGADGEVDDDIEVIAPECTTDDDCPDTPCVTRTCDIDSGLCVAIFLPNNSVCDDGNPCSETDHCNDKGVCVGATALDCDDDNICTDDGCTKATGCINANNFAPCDDGDICTQGDACAGGSCASKLFACNDGNACTADSCDAVSAVCTNAPLDGAACDDGSACTEGDLCEAGLCAAGTIDGCDDDNPCTGDACEGGVCSYTLLKGTECDDGTVCTVDEVCDQGVCTPQGILECEDENDCTVTICDDIEGCQATALVGMICDDESICTLADACDDRGICTGPPAFDCTDDNPCTDNICDPISGCGNPPNKEPCDDGDICSLGDRCSAGACLPGKADCDDDDACTTGTCSDTGCDFEDLTPTCIDTNPCTDDSCDPIEGCLNTDNDVACDDGDACTESDTCAAGICAGTTMICADEDPCTINSCDPSIGCTLEANMGACDDENPCTDATTCSVEGICAAGTVTDTDDGVDCTLDSCAPESGISHEPEDTFCDIGKVCHPTDGCVDGEVFVMVTKIMLVPEDGGAQTIQIRNIGPNAIDLRSVKIGVGAGEPVDIIAVSGDDDEVIPLEAGAVASGVHAGTDALAIAPEITFLYGAADDGFALPVDGSSITLSDSYAVVSDVLVLSPLATIESGPDVGKNAFPVLKGVATELNGATADGALDAGANDSGSNWCAPTAGSMGPAGPGIDCSRAVFNEVMLLGPGLETFVEVHLPAGGQTKSLKARLINKFGSVPSIVTVALFQRAPLSGLIQIEPGALTLPAYSDGSLQLLIGSSVVDTLGFGFLEVPEDPALKVPMAETAPAVAMDPAFSLCRIPDGADTGNNSLDFIPCALTPGMSNMIAP